MSDSLLLTLFVISVVTVIACVLRVVQITRSARREAIFMQLQGPDPSAPKPVRVTLSMDEAEQQLTSALTSVEKWHGWEIKSSRNGIMTAESNWTTTLEQAQGRSKGSISTPMKTKVKMVAQMRKVGMGRETEIAWRYESECVGWHDTALRCDNPETETMCAITNKSIFEKLGALDGKGGSE
jgi:hypothetical protein